MVLGVIGIKLLHLYTIHSRLDRICKDGKRDEKSQPAMFDEACVIRIEATCDGTRNDDKKRGKPQRCRAFCLDVGAGINGQLGQLAMIIFGSP